MPHRHISFSLKHIQARHLSFTSTFSHIHSQTHTYNVLCTHFLIHMSLSHTHTHQTIHSPLPYHADQKPLFLHPTLQRLNFETTDCVLKKKFIPSWRPITKANIWENSPKDWQEHFNLRSDLLPHLYSLHWEDWDRRIPNFGQAKLHSKMV